MADVLDRIGKPSDINQKELISATLFDTFVIPADEAIPAEIELFTSSYKSSYARNESLPLTNGRVVLLQAMKFTHNFEFATEQALKLYEETAQIALKIEDKEYSPMSVGSHLGYSRILNAKNGTSTVSGTTTTIKENAILNSASAPIKLHQDIEVPHQGKISLVLKNAIPDKLLAGGGVLGSSLKTMFPDLDPTKRYYWGQVKYTGLLYRGLK